MTTKNIHEQYLPIEWLNGMVSAKLALHITPEMTKSDVIEWVEKSNIRRNSSINILIDSYDKHTDFTDGDLYLYYDIGIMCGSAGFVIVNDNKITKMITVIRS